MDSKIIMYLEDEKVLNETVSSFLENYYPNLISCENGEEGLAHIRKGTIPDIIITDINMPKMDGKVFLQHVFRLGYCIPSIITSAHICDSEIKEDNSLNLCVKKLCKKPIDIRELVVNIQNILAKR